MEDSSDLEKELAIQIMGQALIDIFKETQTEIKQIGDEINSCLEYCGSYGEKNICYN